MSENFNNNYSRYYDLLYRDKNYQSEAEYVLTTIKKILPASTEILELGCGTGNHAAHFCKVGYQVTGLERSNHMISLGRAKKLPSFTIIEGDIISFELLKKFDVVLALFHVISYLNSNEELISCLKSVRHHLKDGGIFIFDVWYSPAVYHLKPETRIKKLEDADFMVTRIAEPVAKENENLIEVNYEIIIRHKGDQSAEFYNETHPMRHFSEPEIKLLAELTGFRLIKTEEFGTGNAASKKTWGVCFILEKK